MKVIMIMFDSLNRRFLPMYGDEQTIAPNFKRLSEKMVTYNNFYVGSLPCIPARRELHTGRYNFLHRVWGPLEPFDDSLPQILGEHGIYSHCVSDHAHYWQDGGVNYLTKYSTAEMIRGQEGDFWKGQVEGFEGNLDLHRQDEINRKYMQDEKDHPHVKTFEAGMEFLEHNYKQDNWFLQLEYFDPHEPYFVPEKYKQQYTDEALPFDWPFYGETEGHDEEVSEARLNYRALLTMADHYLGQLIDFMDDHDMWKDTMVILNTDHGFMLGEHGYFGKNYMETLPEVANTPFMIWDPRYPETAGEKRDQLCQTPDIPATILDFFGIEKPRDMLGKSILPTVQDKDADIHDYILYGYFGKHVNITDGKYIYMRAGRPGKEDCLYNYTIVPHHMFHLFSLEELRKADPSLCYDFKFTKGVGVMRIPAEDATSPNNSCYQYSRHIKYGDLLYDIHNQKFINDAEIEERMKNHMVELLKINEAPAELYERLELEK